MDLKEACFDARSKNTILSHDIPTCSLYALTEFGKTKHEAAVGTKNEHVFAERDGFVLDLDTKAKTFSAVGVNVKTGVKKEVMVSGVVNQTIWNLLACCAAYAQIEDLQPKLDAYKKAEMDNNPAAAMIEAAEFNIKISSFIGALNFPTSETMFPELNMADLKSGKSSPDTTIFGSFVVAMPDKKKKSPAKKVTKKDLEFKFVLEPNRELNEEERSLMFVIPEFYDISSNVISIADKIKKSWSRPAHLRKTNVLMEGPAGSGKTMDSKVLSALLGIPYTKITCFSDMDSSNLAGALLPVVNEKTGKKERIKMPSSAEIMMDPVGSYQKITGKTDKSITSLEVLDKVTELSKEFYESDEGKGTPEYAYYASEFVKAFENGWLCEIQEPTCIADAAVLLVLNSALEKEGVLNLAQKTVKRHPEFICVMTTNRDYEGCRPLNQALRDRFNIVKNVQLPDTDELVSRLKSSTGCKDETFLNKLVQSANSLNVWLKQEGEVQQVSFRSLQDFVPDIMDGYDLEESVDEDIINVISTDDDYRAEIKTAAENCTEIYNLQYNPDKKSKQKEA